MARPCSQVALDAVANVLTGGPGADFLNTKGGAATADQLDCGTGDDSHRSDPIDTKAGCETLVP